jgi:hypothetical protein
VVRQGQTFVASPTSGRVTGLALVVKDKKLLVYAGTANGGAWCSDDSGQSWRPLMDALNRAGVSDLANKRAAEPAEPVPPPPGVTNAVSKPVAKGPPLAGEPDQISPSSLACGAIAVAADDPDRVYVGTGEGMMGAYFGIGPCVSADGGKNWSTEPCEPSLKGSSFYNLVVDPANKDHVIAATYKGLYRRVPLDGSKKFHWVRCPDAWAYSDPPVTEGRATCVVLARGDGAAKFFAARWGGPVYTSSAKAGALWPELAGSSWSVLGSKFPAGARIVELAVQADNPDVVYALVANEDMFLQGLYRYDETDPTKEWRRVEGVPDDLFGSAAKQSKGQGWYDLAMAIDPSNVNRVYVGGAAVNLGNDWSAALYRLEVTVSKEAIKVTSAFLGDTVHADVHCLTFSPEKPDQLWVGCDGGVFCSVRPLTGGPNVFTACNAGLSTLMMISLGKHPTQAAVLFAGTQDNGCLRYTGEEAWLYSADGDGGAVLVNWRDPYTILSSYTYGVYRWTTNGGQRGSYLYGKVPLLNTEQVAFYPPLAGPPSNPTNPVEADLVAFGSERLWINTTFGVQGWTPYLLQDDWEALCQEQYDRGDSRPTIMSLVFASGQRLFVANTFGSVYRFDYEDDDWKRRPPLDEEDKPRNLLRGPITSIAVDPKDPTGQSIYVTFGGRSEDYDYRRVWHYDPSAPPNQHWQARSGPEGDSTKRLSNIQFNTIVVDPDHINHLYAAADDGMWRSQDAGGTWQRFNAGLPPVAVVDLTLFRSPDRSRPLRLLRAATHGRGAFERNLDGGPGPVELYLRHTPLDEGRYPSLNDLADPTLPGSTVLHTRSPDIKVAMGKSPETPISFLEFQDGLTDASDAVLLDPGCVYVQVHNRGTQPADKVQVMLLWANTQVGLPYLPEGFQQLVQTGQPVNNDWKTIGIQTLNNVRAGVPQVVAFPWPPNELSAIPPGNNGLGLLALVHHEMDKFSATQLNSNTLARVNCMVAMRLLTAG